MRRDTLAKDDDIHMAVQQQSDAPRWSLTHSTEIAFLNQPDQHRAETRQHEARKLQQKPFAWMNVNTAQHSLLLRRGSMYLGLFSTASYLKGFFPLLP